MKLKFYKILFRLFSFLSDTSRGLRFFVKYKLVFGSLIIGLTSSCRGSGSGSGSGNQVTVDSGADSLPPQDSVEFVSCYKPAMPIDSSAKKSQKPSSRIIVSEEIVIPPTIMCYVPAIAPVMCYDPISPEVDSTAIKPDITPIIYITVDEMPKFQGMGLTEFREYVESSVVCPNDLKEKGRVVVSFVVNDKGDVEKPLILKSLSPQADAEVLRVVGSSPRWTPGRQDGENVNVRYTIPVDFYPNSQPK